VLRTTEARIVCADEIPPERLVALTATVLDQRTRCRTGGDAACLPSDWPTRSRPPIDRFTLGPPRSGPLLPMGALGLF